MENLPSTIAKMYKLKFYNATEQIASNLNHAESQATRHPGGERFELVFSKVVPNYNNDTLDHAKEGGRDFDGQNHWRQRSRHGTLGRHDLALHAGSTRVALARDLLWRAKETPPCGSSCRRHLELY